MPIECGYLFLEPPICCMNVIIDYFGITCVKMFVVPKEGQNTKY